LYATGLVHNVCACQDVHTQLSRGAPVDNSVAFLLLFACRHCRSQLQQHLQQQQQQNLQQQENRLLQLNVRAWVAWLPQAW
jgi:hypothetical protein